MKKETILILLFIIIGILSFSLFILSDVLAGGTEQYEIMIATLLFIIGGGTYVYLRKEK